jgi:drug/metabolite transporter (DMT)-like permease
MFVNLALLLAISLAWAAGYLFIGAANHIPPITATAVMTIIGASVIASGVRFGFKHHLLPTLRKRPWVPMLMGVTAIAIPNLSVVAAEHTVPADVAAVLGATVPIATILLTTFVTRESPLSITKMLGIVVALSGLVIFVGGWEELVDDPAAAEGIAIMMAGGLVFALNGIFAARQTHDLDPSALAAWTIIFGAIMLSIAAMLLEQPFSTDLRSAAWPLIAEGTLGMGLAYLGYYILVARAGASFASLYAFLVPVLGVLGTTVVLGAPLTTPHVTGLVVVLVGMGLLTRNGKVGVGRP